MKHAFLIYIAIWGLLISSCGIQTKQTSYAESIQKDSLKTECVPTAFSYPNGSCLTYFLPGIFEETAYLYNSINPEGSIIDTLLFFTPVNLLAEDSGFFLVCTPEAKRGYVKKTDIYLYRLWGKRSTYLLGISDYDVQSYPRNKLKIIKNINNTIAYEYTHGISSAHYEIKRVYSALKSIEALFHIRYTWYSEQGVEEDLFVVDNGKQLSRFILTRLSGDGGYSEETTVYIPVKLSDGKTILLAKNGKLSVDRFTGNVETYPYPEEIQIPIEELVIVVDEVVEIHDREVIQTIYYQWTGTELRDVKTKKGK